MPNVSVTVANGQIHVTANGNKEIPENGIQIAGPTSVTGGGDNFQSGTLANGDYTVTITVNQITQLYFVTVPQGPTPKTAASLIARDKKIRFTPGSGFAGSAKFRNDAPNSTDSSLTGETNDLTPGKYTVTITKDNKTWKYSVTIAQGIQDNTITTI